MFRSSFLLVRQNGFLFVSRPSFYILLSVAHVTVELLFVCFRSLFCAQFLHCVVLGLRCFHHSSQTGRVGSFSL